MTLAARLAALERVRPRCPADCSPFVTVAVRVPPGTSAAERVALLPPIERVCAACGRERSVRIYWLEGAV